MPPEASKKRNRISLSCNYCKRRKVKCDRGDPCTSCIKYNVAGLCEYSRTPGGTNPPIGELLPFSVQNSYDSNNTNVRTMLDSNGGLEKKEDDQNGGSVQSELERLKDKIRQIEASITVSNLSKPITKLSPSPVANSYPSTSMTYNSYDMNQKKSLGKHNTFQLPPLTWRSSSSSTNGSASSEANILGEQGLLLTEYHKASANYKFTGINPYGSPDEIINFYEGCSPIIITSSSRRMNFGPFAWISILSKDIGLGILWRYARRIKEQNIAQKGLIWRQENSNQGNEIQNKPESGSPVDANKLNQDFDQDKEFTEKALDREGYNDIRPYNNILNKNKEGKYTGVTETQRKINMNKNAISLGLTVFEGQIDQELKLFDKIKAVLPKQKVMWILINKFFLSLYPFMPFIDERYFKLEMSRILGPEGYNDSKIKELNIEKRLDLANVGILLIIIRFTYLSLFSNRNKVNESNLRSEDPSTKAQELKYLLSNPISIDVINMAQLCLDQFDLLRKSNLSILQCAFLMRLYHIFAPEEGDGADGGDSQIYTGMLVHMASSMGLNREPDNFPETFNDDKVNNIGRKIWLFLILCDFNQACIYGNPLCVDEKYMDAKPPYYKPGNENIIDQELEKNVLSTFAYFDKFYNKLKPLLELTLSIKSATKMGELTTILNDFENFIDQHYGKLAQFFIPFSEDKFSYPFIKIMKCKNYINLSNFNMVVLFHIFSYYEKKKNSELSFFYLKKVYSLMLREFTEGLFHLIANNHINFGEGADLFLNPSLEQVIHKSTQINYAILVRLKVQISKMNTNQDHNIRIDNDFNYRMEYENLTVLEKQIQKLIEIFIAAISRLSNRYYYAWKVKKTFRFFIGSCGIDEILQREDAVELPELNISEVKELSQMFETSLKKLHDIKLAHMAENCSTLKENTFLGSSTNDVAYSNIQADATLPLTPGMSVNSVNPLSFEDMGLLNDNEIDQLWMNMEYMKNDPNTNSDGSTNGDNPYLHPSQTPGSFFKNGTPYSNVDFNDITLDVFKNTNLDHVLESNYNL